MEMWIRTRWRQWKQKSKYVRTLERQEQPSSVATYIVWKKGGKASLRCRAWKNGTVIKIGQVGWRGGLEVRGDGQNSRYVKGGAQNSIQCGIQLTTGNMALKLRRQARAPLKFTYYVFLLHIFHKWLEMYGLWQQSTFQFSNLFIGLALLSLEQSYWKTSQDFFISPWSQWTSTKSTFQKVLVLCARTFLRGF